jgi:hypothetical protein
MPTKRLILCLIISICSKVFSQENPLKIVLSLNKNVVEEGRTIKLQLNATGGLDSNYVFAVSQGFREGMTIDSLGNFEWTPSYDLVERLNKEKTFQVIFNVKNKSKESDNQVFNFVVIHKNRTPTIGELKPFYVRYNAQSTYQMDDESIKDPDNDPIVFVPIIDQMPEGMRLSARGELTWTPSIMQFKQLREKPLLIPFFVEDQPSKSQIKGSLKVMVTQMDLPPAINCIPNLNKIVANENQLINLGFYLSDPNGDDDIAVFDFLTTNAGISKEVVVKNTPTQYEFLWQPGYDFVKDPADSVNFSITFFVLDKSQQREEKTIDFTIINTVNEVEKDAKLYALYQSTMSKAWELLEQMKDKENDLKKSYQRAKRGKKNRSIINATLGATTGLSPVLSKTLERQRLISTIGGTSVLTISTLEATEVIGRSMKDLVERLNYVIEKKNEIQTKGDIFARDFALKSARRNPEFLKKIDVFSESMSLKGLVILELDAGYTPKQKASDEVIKKTFREFSSVE